MIGMPPDPRQMISGRNTNKAADEIFVVRWTDSQHRTFLTSISSILTDVELESLYVPPAGVVILSWDT